MTRSWQGRGPIHATCRAASRSAARPSERRLRREKTREVNLRAGARGIERQNHMAIRVIWPAVLAGTVVGGLSTTAAAERVDLVVFEGSHFAGLDVWLDVVDRGSEVDFVFRNDSSIGSSVASVYFENVPVA